MRLGARLWGRPPSYQPVQREKREGKDELEAQQEQPDEEAGPGKWPVRILDQTGASWTLPVSSRTTISDLKEIVSEATGVDVAMQRLVYLGGMLVDSERTLASLRVTSGSTIHLFERPKAAVGLRVVDEVTAGSSMLPAVNVRPQIDPTESARKGIQLLATLLFVISSIQVVQAMAIIGATEGGDQSEDCPLPAPFYWTLGENLLGVVVGILGIRGSLNLFVAGLVLSGSVFLCIHISVLIMLARGSVTFSCPCSDDTSSSPGSNSQYGCEDEPHFTATDMVLQAVLDLIIPSFVWFWCCWRAQGYARDIRSLS
jgi:hypothetical protein